MEDNVLGTKPVFPLVVTLSVPIVFSMAIQALYNIVDSIFLSRYDTVEFAAVSLVQPVMFLLSSVGSGLGIGFSSLLSRRMGEGKKEKAEECVGGAFAFTLLLAIVITALALCLFRPLLSLVAGESGLLNISSSYALICISAFTFQLFAIECSYLLQAQSLARCSMAVQISGCIVNIVLDPVFIFVLGLGAKGAALATALGFLVSFGFGLLLFGRKTLVRLKKVNLRLDKTFVAEVSKVGLPAFLTQASASIVGYILNGLVITFGVTAMAVYGMYLKAESFMFLATQGIGSALVSIVGYNYGAGNRERILRSVRISLSLGWGVMLIGFALFQCFAPAFVHIFTSDPETVAMAIPAFRSISFCFLLTAPQIVFSSFFQGLGKGGRAMFTMNMRFYVFLLPIAFFTASRFGLKGLWFCYFGADLFAFPLALTVYFHTKRKLLDLSQFCD